MNLLVLKDKIGHYIKSQKGLVMFNVLGLAANSP